MNFFKAQERSRRKTVLLILLFIFAVVLIVLSVCVTVMIAFFFISNKTPTHTNLDAVFNLHTFSLVSIATLSVILCGSITKINALSEGGKVIAEALGGRVIPTNSPDLAHKKVINIVEEMAIASGISVPTVYLLNEPGINAFAAGWSPSNAVIGVTQGAIAHLSREELQGVIAHEFSHIFNGDMRLNLRLTGILHGILLIGHIGRKLIHFIRHARINLKRGGNPTIVLLLLGYCLVLIGSIGTFFGSWIKATISWQREYLADATAVQYTRNAQGVANALKKIGGLKSHLETPSAPEYSHAYFAEGIPSYLFATHPLLKTRIKRIEPNWDRRFIRTKAEPLATPMPDATIGSLKREVTTKIMVTSLIELMHDIDNIGNVSVKDQQAASKLIQQIPETIKLETNDPYGARAIIYAFLIHKDKTEKNKQCLYLKQSLEADVYEKTVALHKQITALDMTFRLPIIELCFPALRLLSRQQYQIFRKNINALILSDNKINFQEWVLYRLIKQQVDEAYGLRKPAKATLIYIGAVKAEMEMLLSISAYLEHADDASAHEAFKAGIKSIGAMALKIIPRSETSLRKMNEVMDRLEQVKPPIKEKILKALIVCLTNNGTVTLEGKEILRTVASCLDTPLAFKST